MKGPIRFRGSLSAPCFNIDLAGAQVPRTLVVPSNLTIIAIMSMIDAENAADGMTMCEKIMTLFMTISKKG
jgi:hypothetical protein